MIRYNLKYLFSRNSIQYSTSFYNQQSNYYEPKIHLSTLLRNNKDAVEIEKTLCLKTQECNWKTKYITYVQNIRELYKDI